MLIASGTNIKVVQARMRHANAKTTLDTYAICGRIQTSPPARQSPNGWTRILLLRTDSPNQA
ncbi:hypothetical protein OIE68_44050 [Nocardia vinacea]|uniref:hypothetical protein n=1 Tax=Nocardia vinacea TaxID=96468 RepID=UPI002E101DF2|nr:hypothetical protein OIE68_44050 [Nocardia vinacea]